MFASLNESILGLCLVRLFDFDPCRLARQVSEFGNLDEAACSLPPQPIFAASDGEEGMTRYVAITSRRKRVAPRKPTFIESADR